MNSLLKRRIPLHRFIMGTGGFIVVILFWYGISASGWFSPGLLPAPHEVLSKTWNLAVHGTLLVDLRASVLRVLAGVVIGVFLAIPAGSILAWSRVMFTMFDPAMNFFRALPPIALIPLVVVYFGIGESARLIVLIYAAFFSAIVVIFEGVSGINPLFLKAGQALGASRSEVFTRIVLPLLVPTVLVAVRVALGVTWASLVAAELVAAQIGLGAMISQAGNFFKIPDIYSGIIIIGLAALIMDAVIRLLTARIVRWQDRATA